MLDQMRLYTAVATCAEDGKENEQIANTCGNIVVQISNAIVHAAQISEQYQKIADVNYAIKIEVACAKFIALVKAIGEHVLLTIHG